MARILLDSTVLIDLLGGRPVARRIRDMWREGGEPWACAISVEEIWRGLRASEQHAASRSFSGLRIAPLGASEGEMAGTWRRDHAARGATLHQADYLIAAAAVGTGADLATGNPGDFSVLGDRVRDWSAGR